ncbi:response regulator [Paenibacillus allorhizosphaerae]|uniref:Regulator of RpoS n=1 Tax=Paenibacillus allorhizosphaerae TaxID=2849866 RepID=A0ABN7TKJ0_9BACL|nr:response regulator [Paenibacillus allorhizosphaerae]CAG7644037.1 Regulator of RpoS [Paenibacillus allorhizosphaerae]
MIKILLVDDEVAISSGMKKLIAKLDGESFVVAEAYDGAEALEMIEEFDPDVLLTDMRMPRMDGMQLLREARKRKPDLLTAVISAYSDYDYIREAMLMHASDYLLKPITAHSLRELLDKLKQKYEGLFRNKEQETVEMLLQGAPSEYCLPVLNYAYYALLLVCAGPYSNGVVEMCPGESFWQSRIVASRLESLEQLGIRHWLANGERSNERLVVLASNRDDAEDCIRRELDDFIGQIAAGPIPVTFAIDTGLSMNQLSASSKQLRRELLQSLIFAKSSLLYVKDNAPKETDAERSFVEETAKVMEAVGQKRYELLTEELNKLTASWEAHYATQYVILQTLYRVLAGLGQLGLDRQMDLEMLVSQSQSYHDLNEKLSPFFYALFQSADLEYKPPSSYSVVEQVEQYLKANYREAISLQSLSREFGLVPNYLSVLFKKENGLTPLEYLMDYRINEAKRIMDAQPNLLLKQVSSEVGYADQLYFSRVFKKRTGLSPSEYVQSRQR